MHYQQKHRAMISLTSRGTPPDPRMQSLILPRDSTSQSPDTILLNRGTPPDPRMQSFILQRDSTSQSPDPRMYNS